MFRLFECCALSFFERFVLSFSLKIERFVSDSAEIWICGLYKVFQCKQQVLWEAYVLRFSQMPHYDCHFMLQKAVAEFVVARFVQFFL